MTSFNVILSYTQGSFNQYLKNKAKQNKMKSSDAKASKCRLKSSSNEHFYQAAMFRFSNLTLMAMSRSFSMQLK